MPDYASEDQWIAIQHKTFVNWANEQLRMSNRSVDDLGEDLSDGVRLVALVEALQFRKIGKVYPRPLTRIQMMHNVSLALQAIADDKVRLVNIGTDDIVDGSLKLTLGLLWHLILRYQISSARAAPPRKLMLSWFRSILPTELGITNLTSSWRDGLALHALLEHCKPGLSPHWRNLSPHDSVHNCHTAMQLAKEKLGIPGVISAEDFASPDLDELSAMTYLSYFIRKNSPGYIDTVEWVSNKLGCPVKNFTTDWNDGKLLCKLVHAMGGEIPGWPYLDTTNSIATCQLGIAAAFSLGVPKTITPTEMADANMDHLTIMAYLSQFRNITPQLPKAQRCRLECALKEASIGREVVFNILVASNETDTSRVTVIVSGHRSRLPCKIEWTGKRAHCSFVPIEIGQHMIHAHYDEEEIQGSPVTLPVGHDLSRIKITGETGPVRAGKTMYISIVCPGELCDSIEVRLLSPVGQLQSLSLRQTEAGLATTFVPHTVGIWTYQTLLGSHEISSDKVMAFDCSVARLSGPDFGVVGEECSLPVDVRRSGIEELHAEVEYSTDHRPTEASVSPSGDLRYVTFVPEGEGVYTVNVTVMEEHVSDSPKSITVVDPGKIRITGQGHVKGVKGVESHFSVNTSGLSGDVNARVKGPNGVCRVKKSNSSLTVLNFSYTPDVVGTYEVEIIWENRPLPGSPFQARVTDSRQITFLGDLSELQDEHKCLALKSGEPRVLKFDLRHAGPGSFTAEVLSPHGKLPIIVDQDPNVAAVSIQADKKGDHYVHLYWNDEAIEMSPILAYCIGPRLPVDASKVKIRGSGAETGTATRMSEFVIDGKAAGPGVPRVQLQMYDQEVAVEMKPLHYDRYRCKYTASKPGDHILDVYWSDSLVPGSPFKVTILPKGDPAKVKVIGSGLSSGVVGQELAVVIDMVEAGPGDLSTSFIKVNGASVPCDITRGSPGRFDFRTIPLEPGPHKLHVTLDGDHIKGSPFPVYVLAAPDPNKVRVFGPGIEDGIVGEFESRFLVDTDGAGAGQLAVKIRGPKGGFKVDMKQHTKTERTINCRYDPTEAGEYEIHVRWSGVHVPGSPFTVHLAETRDQLEKLTNERGFRVREERVGGWKVEI